MWVRSQLRTENLELKTLTPGQWLEHSRILSFGPPGEEHFWIGSADMMERNLDRRVEAITPVTDAENQTKLRAIIDVMLRDDRRAWQESASRSVSDQWSAGSWSTPESSCSAVATESGSTSGRQT